MGILRFSSVCLLLLMLIIPNAFGGGFAFDGLGVKARGMGGAFRAVADDWSAAYYNPAGYNRIPDNQIAGNMAAIHNRYTIIPGITWGDYEETGFYYEQEIYNEHEILSVPQGGILFHLPVAGHETVFGLSILQTFDQNQSWELYSNIPTYNKAALPSKQFYNNLDIVAFQATAATGFMEDRLSVGIGVSILRGDLIFNSLILRDNPMPSPISDRPYDKIPEWYTNDGSGWGFGYKLGLLYEANEKLDLALVLNGNSSIDIEGSSLFKFYLGDNPTEAISYFDTTEEHYFLEGNVEEINADFKTTLDLPASIGAGIAYDLTDKLTLAMDVEYVFWSAFEGFEFTFDNYSGLPQAGFTRANSLMKQDITVPAEWDDAGRVMLGADYKLEEFVDLRLGFGIDQTVVSETTFMPQFFDLTTKYNYSIGVGFEVDFWHLDLTTTYTHHSDLGISSSVDVDDDGLMDNFAGDYNGDVYQTILGISYRF